MSTHKEWVVRFANAGVTQAQEDLLKMKGNTMQFKDLPIGALFSHEYYGGSDRVWQKKKEGYVTGNAKIIAVTDDSLQGYVGAFGSWNPAWPVFPYTTPTKPKPLTYADLKPGTIFRWTCKYGNRAPQLKIHNGMRVWLGAVGVYLSWEATLPASATEPVEILATPEEAAESFAKAFPLS